MQRMEMVKHVSANFVYLTKDWFSSRLEFNLQCSILYLKRYTVALDQTTHMVVGYSYRMAPTRTLSHCRDTACLSLHPPIFSKSFKVHKLWDFSISFIIFSLFNHLLFLTIFPVHLCTFKFYRASSSRFGISIAGSKSFRWSRYCCENTQSTSRRSQLSWYGRSSFYSITFC